MSPKDPSDPLQLAPLFAGGAEPWAPILRPVIEAQPEAAKFIGPARKASIVPVRELTFQALKPNAPERWKIVAFGQNPYPRPESATGIAMFDNAFHSWQDKRFEYVASMRNLIKAALLWRHGVAPDADVHQLRALLAEHQVVSPPEWFQAMLAQGVLLLNASLTASADNSIAIEDHVAFWQPVTRAIVAAILAAKEAADPKRKGVVFAWWGLHARTLKPMVQSLQALHPTVPVQHVDHWNPAARDDRFYRNNHFKDLNAALLSVGASRVAWLPTPGWAERLLDTPDTGAKMGAFVQETIDLHKLYLARLQGVQDEQLADLAPIDGVLAAPRPTITEALAAASGRVPSLAAVAASARSFAAQRVASDGGLLLDEDEVAAVYLYTTGSGLYSTLNAALRDRDRSAVGPFLPYLRLLLAALERLAPREVTLWRGVGLDLRAQYPVGATVTWWGVSSCTSNSSVAMGFGGGVGTLFEVRARRAVSIRRFSAFSNEEEFVLAPGTRLTVAGLQRGASGAHKVTLDEHHGARLVG